MTKIVYNACFGGFGLSDKAIKLYAKLKGIKLYPEVQEFGNHLHLLKHTVYWTIPKKQRTGKPVQPVVVGSLEWRRYHEFVTEHTFDADSLDRADPILVQVVEQLGHKASGAFADLQISNVPNGVRYRIEGYDGNELVKTIDSYDWKVA